MTTSHLEIDFTQEPPSNVQIDKMYSTLVIKPLPLMSDIRVTEFLETIKSKYSNGNVLFYQFFVDGDKSFNFFASRNTLQEIDFINKFIFSKTFQNVAKEFTRMDRIELSHSDWATDIFSLPGDLAKIIYHGGAYSQDHFSAEHAFTMAVNFTDAISGKRYADFNSWNLGSEWTDWFFNIAWDYSILLFDKKESIVTILCLTDTD